MSTPIQPVVLRRFGNSELQWSPLGLGCWQFSKGRGMVGGFWPNLDSKIIQDIVRTSITGGINWFDTAEVYGKGESEQALAAALNALHASEKEAHIATKWWPAFRTAGNIPATIEQRIQALSGRTIDLYQIHQPFSFSTVSAEMREMAKLAQAGKIRHVGVSNFNAKQMIQADRTLKEFGLRLVSNQVKYSMLDRRIERNGVMDAAKELGVAIIAYSPLEQGILSGKFHKDPSLVKNIVGPRKWFSGFKAERMQQTRPLIDRLDELASTYNASVSQVALNWTVHAHGETVFAIPGASKVSHAEDNVKAMRFRLTREEIQELNEMSLSYGK
ncbi:aldo/keto reductase [Paenibacillus swuensis]|uniref:Aldo/keto reductase n=1 Tax=Paenibacillus swuensis TaxID=1178515 RepID=A0A172TI49_9BACL|nr:aldo/keto reductase [Paenibacillus swuensis]ANE46574.1 aldo/keto reductase [Paenibacillus swuensis]